MSSSPYDPVHEDNIEASPRSFGLTFAAVFALYGSWPLVRNGEARVWALVAAVAIGLIALAAPVWLKYPSRVWQRIGLALHYVINPIVMAALFFVVITPFGLVKRRLDPNWSARFRTDPNATSYWITRPSTSSSMRQQF